MMWMDRVATAVLAPIRGNRIFFGFMYLLGAICVVFVAYGGSRLVALFQLFSDLYIVCALLLAFPPGVRRYVRGMLYVVFYLLAVVDMACYVRLGSPITPIYLELLRHTDVREAGEALSAYCSWKMLFSPLAVILLLLGGNVAAVFRKNGVPRLFLRKCSCLLRPAAVVVSVTFCIGFFATWDSKEYIYYRVFRSMDELEVQQLKDYSPKTTYYIPVYRFVYAWAESNRLSATREKLSATFAKAKVTGCDATSPLIVLIIGESCNRHHFPIYGYDKPTTPHLSARARGEGLAVFTDVVSSWNVTCESFENMFSTHCVGLPDDWASYPLFPQLFRLAGYRTAFYSNQYVMGGGGVSAFKEDLFINNPVFSRQMFDVRNDSTHEFDLGLVDDYRRQALPADVPQLHIFHFLGVHFDFNQRFPKERTVFKPADYRRPDLLETDRQVMADYDNALRYNDYVTEQIVRQFEHREAIVIFLADHGERVFDEGSADWGRSLVWTAGNVRQQYDIPFWIYATPAYRQRHAGIWARIMAVRHKPLMTDALPHLLLHLAGISTPWYSAAHDILSERYDSGRRRVLNGETDYDAFLK